MSATGGPVQGAVVALPAPGGRYLRVQLLGDSDDVAAYLPAALPLSPTVGQRLLLDLVGRVLVVRCDAP